MSKIRVCATCHKSEDQVMDRPRRLRSKRVKIQACSRCQVVNYCSEACEKANFYHHKLVCVHAHKIGPGPMIALWSIINDHSNFKATEMLANMLLENSHYMMDSVSHLEAAFFSLIELGKFNSCICLVFSVAF